MHFEKTFLPIKELVPLEKFECNYICILNESKSRPPNSQIDFGALSTFMEQTGIPIQTNYPELVRSFIGLISNSRGRFCRFLGGYDTMDFQKDDFMIITYITYKGKNYINGFVKVKTTDIPNIIRTNYICTDLYFSGIGKALISLLKVITSYLGIQKVRISSILRPSTQNFYTSQGFYPIPEQMDEGTYVWFEWNSRFTSKKDRVNMRSIQQPFLVTYEPSKFDKNKERVDSTELIPYRAVRTHASLSPRSPRTSPRRSPSPSPEIMDSIFRQVESPRSVRARGKKRNKTKKHKSHKRNPKRRINDSL